MKFEPMGHIVVLQALTPNQVRDIVFGDMNISIPESADIPDNIGRVVAIGPGLLTSNGTRVPPQCAVGDLVIFDGKFGGKVQLFRQEYGMMPESGGVICKLVFEKGEKQPQIKEEK